MEMSLIPSFKESVFSSAVEIGVDLVEVGIDSCLNEGILKDIPFVDVIYKLGNIAMSIRERHLLQKALAFIQEINSGTVSDEDRDCHKEELEANAQKMEQELGFILVSIDRHLQAIKSKILARFYAAYLDSSNNYDWVDFCILAEILDEISVYDFDALCYIRQHEPVKSLNSISLFQVTRLEKCGVIYRENGAQKLNLKLSPQGEIFCELGCLEDFIDIQERTDSDGD